ncbi:MAG: indole-3-glycerol phosphate synthase TrpC [Spirochaetaceae bacterium]|nr:indole-3-glycerol phosphate synthase TrpC [Spirochaetaceae bacterium]
MILDDIAQATKKRVACAKKIESPRQVQEKAEMLAAQESVPAVKKNDTDIVLPFEKALSSPGLSFICEIKRASPSKGLIAEDFPYLKIAKAYETTGASAISVLTEPDFFKGSNRYLQEVVREVSVPVLRKDFTIDKYQIYEAKILGASAVLLICALLDNKTLKSFLSIARGLNLDALVEAHNEDEIKNALDVGARIIGVNNRDLTTFKIDINNSLRLRPLVPKDRIFVAESGINTPEDIATLQAASVDAVLIGEALMRSGDKKKALLSFKSLN